MSDLFDKLNLLLRSSLDNLRTNLPAGADQPRREDVPPEELSARSIADLERQVATMRKQIDAALSSEDAMQERLTKLQEQVAAYDQAADAALDRGDEDEARRLIQQMQNQRRLATMISAELEDHRSATSEFIVRVNMLEATVSDAKRAQGHEPTDPTAAKPGVPNIQISPELVELGKQTTTALNDVVRTLRERAEAALAPMIPRPTDQPDPTTPPSIPTIKQETPITPEAPATNIKVKVNPTGETPTVPAVKQETPITSEAPAVNIKVKVNPTGETPAVAAPTTSDTSSTSDTSGMPDKPVSDKDVDDDLARRRSRLSKPD